LFGLNKQKVIEKDMASTLKDMTTMARVCQSTVSRVLRDQENLKILDSTK